MDRDALRNDIRQLLAALILDHDAPIKEASLVETSDALLTLIEPLVGVVEAVEDQAARHGRGCSIYDEGGACHHHQTAFVLTAMAHLRAALVREAV